MKVIWITPAYDLEMRPEGIYSILASARYRAIIPARELAARGHQASVIGLNAECFDAVLEQLLDADRVVFRKNYFEAECTERMLQEVRGRGVKTLFDLSDDRLTSWEGPHIQRMISQVDMIVTASPMLQEIVRQHTKRESFVVSDPFEGPKGEARWSPVGRRLKALWFGHPTNLDSLNTTIPALLQVGRKSPIDLRILTQRTDGIERECKESNRRHRNALSLRFAEWSLAETWSSLATTDFVIVPSKLDERQLLVKSPNRIIESLWAGRFVVAHPIPSYEEFGDWAWLGENLAEGIAWMVDNGPLIVDRTRAAQDYIASTYSPQRIAAEWEKILEKT